MMKRFEPSEISTQTQMKSSVQRAIRQKLIAEFPNIEPILESILPKKVPIVASKFPNHITVITVRNEPLFFQHRDGPWIPTLRLIHKYPNILPKMQVDRGAIKHVLRGSNIMCPGLTSKGGKMDDVESGIVVQVVAEGKFHALAVGLTTMSSAEIREKNHDVCIENMHYLNDGLWTTQTLS